ncbi:MAG: ATP-binding cassette domain-containing protein [Eubacteriales bacterium]|nr:ATP-binding cassette domain-containing protein [Eubacteriales bacterium]
MILAEKFSYSYPYKDLYENVTFTIEDYKHCAFIGSNGTGKSTLVNILMNPEKYLYDGKIEISEGTRIGFVSQFYEPDENNETTVFDYLCEDFVRIQNELNDVCSQMETSQDITSLFERYQNILDQFDSMGGSDYEITIKKQLKTANLKHCENLKLNGLSGGEFKLVQILKEMIVMPNLLIMDEPDVFLDFDNLDGLKNLINSFKGTLLVITHNRFLLNSCFNKILHLENKEIQEFDGTYAEYNITLLKTKIELQELAAKDTEEIERNKKLVEKLTKDAADFNNAALGRSLKARKSIVERLEARRIKAPFVDIRQPQIHFYTDTSGLSEPVIKVEDVNIGYDTTLLEHVTFEIGNNDKAAIVGPNGTGKTTLLREIFKNEHKRIKVGEDVCMAYLSQKHTEMFDGKEKVSDIFLKLGFDTKLEIKEYLSGFCFDEDIVESSVDKLSGGEKNLLQLSIIAKGNANVLLLDEPTSHLDTYAQLAMEKAVEEYNGAVLMISHDFITIANCVDYVLLVEDNSIRKVSARKFRKMIYANHFDKDYLEKEQKRKELENKIASALKDNDYEKAELLIQDMQV